MLKLMFPFIMIVVSVLGCGNSPKTTTQTVNTTVPTPVEYKMDVRGQRLRIQDEGMDEQKIKENIANIDKSVTFELLKKNAEKYAGKPWAVKGKILQIADIDGGTEARIALDGGGNKIIFASGSLSNDFVEKNEVYVIGYLAGNYTYTSQANWTITIPAMAIRAMIKPQDVAKYQIKKKR